MARRCSLTSKKVYVMKARRDPWFFPDWVVLWGSLIFGPVIGGFLGIAGLIGHIMEQDPSGCLGFRHPWWFHLVLIGIGMAVALFLDGHSRKPTTIKHIKSLWGNGYIEED